MSLLALLIIYLPPASHKKGTGQGKTREKNLERVGQLPSVVAGSGHSQGREWCRVGERPWDGGRAQSSLCGLAEAYRPSPYQNCVFKFMKHRIRRKSTYI